MKDKEIKEMDITITDFLNGILGHIPRTLKFFQRVSNSLSIPHGHPGAYQ